MPLHVAAEPVQDPRTQIWRYPRLLDSDRDIVPFHKMILLLWKAHHNIQIVSSASFSGYLLKYEMKADCIGDLDLAPHPYLQATFPQLTQEEAHVATAYASSRLVSPCEAAIVNAGISMLQHPCVRYIDTRLPTSSSTARYAVYLSSMDIYMLRPQDLHHLSFCAFHQEYTTQKNMAKSLDDVHGTCAGTPPCFARQHNLALLLFLDVVFWFNTDSD